MNLISQVLFFFGALGVFNAVIISAYFILFRKIKRISNLFFGFFLFMLCVRIIKSIFYYFDTNEVRFLLQTGYIACIFIGPFLYFYIKSVYQPKSKINNNWKYHIVIWLLADITIHYFYPFKTNVTLWKNYILDFIDIQWLAYLMASGVILKKPFTKILQRKENLTVLERWLINLLLATFIVWTIFFFTDFKHFIAGSISFSFLFYAFLLFFFFNKKSTLIIFSEKQKYSDKKIDYTQASVLINRLDSIMKEQKLYKKSKLKLSDVAKQLQISTHQFSQLINDNLGKSFSVFLNEYRIEEAKTMLKTNTKYTLEAIGNESGFNSKSTFFTTFKKLVGTTPAKYKEQL